MMLTEDYFSQATDRIFNESLSPTATESDASSGSYRLRLIFGSASLARAFLPSFVRCPPGRADLSIAFATAEQIDLSDLIPRPPSNYRLLVNSGRYALWQPGPRPFLTVFDRQSNRAIVWLGTGSAPSWLLSRPALPIMHAFAIDTPWLGTHGGAVGRAGRFLLLAGRGRAGKTTTALACARAGWDYAGDDYVFTDTSNGRIEPLYASARLRIDMAQSFTDLLHASAEVSEDDGELRHELRLSAHLNSRQIAGGSLAAILLPRRRGAHRVEFSPGRPSDAFTALLTVTTTQLPGWPKVVAEKLAALVGLAPVFFVDTGPDPAAIPGALAEFLDDL